MSFFGCESWSDFLGKVDAGLVLPEPAQLFYAAFSSTDGREEADAVWRDGDGFRALSFHHVPDALGCQRSENAHISELSAEDCLWRLMSRCADDILSEAGKEVRYGGSGACHPGLSRHIFGHTQTIAAERGSRIAWQVTCTSGEWESSHTSVVGVYEDPSLAVAHARAAMLAEEAEEDPEGEFDGPSAWGVEHVVIRSSLPPELIAFASGERVPPERPSRLRTEAYGYLVQVPGRGSVEFDNFGCERVSAAFMCALPLAKPTLRQRSDARGDAGLVEVRAEGEGAISYTFGDAGSDGLRGVARATGPDAARLLSEIPAAVAASIRANEWGRAGVDATEDCALD